MDERGEPYPKRSRIDSTDEALSLNSNLPDELSLLNCPPPTTTSLFPVQTTSSYVNSNNIFTASSSTIMSENHNLWMSSHKHHSDKVLLTDNSSAKIHMPKTLNNPRLQNNSPSLSFGNGPIHHVNPAFSPSPTFADGIGNTKIQTIVGQKRPYSASGYQSTQQPATHMLPLVPQSGMNVRVMSLNSTNKDSGGMFSTYSPLQVAPSKPSQPNTFGENIGMKKKLIQKQLVLLLHAYKCHRREHSSPGDKGSTPPKSCNLPQCPLMKDVLKHMSTCNEGKNCKVMHCSTSRQIIAHWKSCHKNECIICAPLRHCNHYNNNNNFTTTGAALPVGFIDGASNILPSPNLRMPMNSNHQSGIITINNSCPPSAQIMGSKPWHASITEDLRNHLVKKLVQAIMPQNDMLKHPHIKNLVNYAKKVERENFEKADSRDEYYQSLAGEIYRMQKDLGLQNPDHDLQPDPQGRVLPIHDKILSNMSAIKVNNNFGDHQVHGMNMQDRLNLLTTSNNASVSLPDLLGNDSGLKNSFVIKTESLTPPLMPYQNISVPSSSSSLLPDLNSLQYQKEMMKSSHSFSSHLPASSDFKNKQNKSGMSSNLQQIKAELMLSPFPTSIDSNASTSDFLLDVISHAPSVGTSPMDCLGHFFPTSNNKMNDMIDCNISLGSLVGNDCPPEAFHPITSSSSLPYNVPSSNSIGDLLSCSLNRQEVGTRSVCSPLFTPVSSTFTTPFENIPIKKEEFPPLKEEANSQEYHDPPKIQVKTEPLDESGEEIKNVKEEVKVKEEPWDVVIEPRVFSQEELYNAFLTSLEKMYKQEPDAIPFREPVDPISLNIPDYYNIIQNPMDLSTIRSKLELGQYTEPWQYINDVHLMFENAWLYNKKSSKVYKFCTKLCEIFQAEIDAPMRSLGFCCGQKLVFTPQAICCYGKELCTIAREAIYHHYDNKYTYCEKCFADITKSEVEIDDPSHPGLRIKKDDFIKEKNDKFESELFVECSDCRRKLHKICALHFEPVNSHKFVCSGCLRAKNGKRKENKFAAKKLPNTKLGTYLENRVNQLLKKKDVGDAEVVIRVLSSLDKSVEVKPAMKQKFEHSMSMTFPYRVKTVFAFTEIDGTDVCFFGMHVQEYGSDCPEPNARRVYVAYLDSVNFFRPRQYRTAIYHEILVGYLEYAKSLGFLTAHIWACPPSEGDDYIFHCHPPDQRIPKPKRLQEWYKKMLDKAVDDRVIVEYKDVLQDSQENQLTCVTGLPYFEGDFWPTILEESIAEEKQKMMIKREEDEDDGDDFDNPLSYDDSFPDSQNGHSNDKKKPHKNNNGKKRSVKNKKNSKSRSKSSLQQSGHDDLLYKLFQTMEKYKEVFFVIYLQDDIHSLRQSPSSLPAIVDPDPIMSTDLMDGRDAFLTMCRERHLEFSSLRRAKFSSMAMLYELHVQMRESAVCCNCQNCKVSVETRYHCTICEDFDLCLTCYASAQHPHRMIKIGLGLEDSGPTPSPSSSSSPRDKYGVQSTDPQIKNGTSNDSTRKPQLTQMQRYIQALMHAASCRDANCHTGSCKKLKSYISHIEKCRQKKGVHCGICPQMRNICLAHARTCKEQNKCPVPACNGLRRKFDAKRNNERMNHELLTRRRIQNMKFEEAVISPMSNTPKNSNSSASFAQADENFVMPGQYFNQPAASKHFPQSNAMTPEMPVNPKAVTVGSEFTNYDSNSSSPLTLSPNVQHLSPRQQLLQSPQQRVPSITPAMSPSGGLSPQKAKMLQQIIHYIKSNNKNSQSVSDMVRLLRTNQPFLASILQVIKGRNSLKGTPSNVNGPTQQTSASASTSFSDVAGTHHLNDQMKNQQMSSLQFSDQSNQSNFMQQQPQQQVPANHNVQQQYMMQQQQVQNSPAMQQQQSQQVVQQPSLQQVTTQHVVTQQSQAIQQRPQQALQQKLSQAHHAQQLQQQQQISQHLPQPQQQIHQHLPQQQQLPPQQQWFLQQDQQMNHQVNFDQGIKTYQHHQMAEGDGTNESLKMFPEGSSYNHFANSSGMWEKAVPMKSGKNPMPSVQYRHQQFIQQRAMYSNQQAIDPNMDSMSRSRSRMGHYHMNMVSFRGGNPGAQTSLTFDNSAKEVTPTASLTNSHVSFQSTPYNADINPSQQHIHQQQNLMRASFVSQDSSYQGNMTTFPNHQVLRPAGPGMPMRHLVPHQQQILNTQSFGYVSMDSIPANNLPSPSYVQLAGQRFARPQNGGSQGQIRMHRPQFNQMGMNQMPQGDYSYPGNNYSFSQQFQQQQQQQQQLMHQQSQMVDPSLMCPPTPIPAGAYSIQAANQFQLLESSDDVSHQMLP